MPGRSEEEIECGYHAWTKSRRDAYDNAHYLSESYFHDEPIKFGKSCLYEKNGEYFSMLSGWFYDQVVPVSFNEGFSADNIKNIFDQYRETVNGKKEMINKLSENIASLEKVFGWKAE